jgi:hypothetical protein
VKHSWGRDVYTFYSTVEERSDMAWFMLGIWKIKMKKGGRKILPMSGGGEQIPLTVEMPRKTDM